MKKGYIPRPMAGFLIWLNQFKTQLPNVAVTVGVPPTDAETMSDYYTTLDTTVKDSQAADAVAQQRTTDMNNTRKLVEQFARQIAQRIKKHKDYTPAIGELLGIEGPEDSTNMDEAKPELKIVLRPGGIVEVKFVKANSDGVNLYSQRDGEAAPAFLARDTVSPYIDNRPMLVANKPETRRYKAVYVVDDQEVGLESDEVVVVVKP